MFSLSLCWFSLGTLGSSQTVSVIRLTGVSKLLVGVDVSACLSLCVSPATDNRTVRGAPCLLSCGRWDIYLHYYSSYLVVETCTSI